jgi:hypothetical protein
MRNLNKNQRRILTVFKSESNDSELIRTSDQSNTKRVVNFETVGVRLALGRRIEQIQFHMLFEVEFLMFLFNINMLRHLFKEKIIDIKASLFLLVLPFLFKFYKLNILEYRIFL